MVYIFKSVKLTPIFAEFRSFYMSLIYLGLPEGRIDVTQSDQSDWLIPLSVPL